MMCLAACSNVASKAWGKEKSPTVYRVVSPPKPDFSQLGWLLGEWAGKIGNKEPVGNAHFSAAYDLDQRFMIFREELSFDATKNAPAYKDSWIGILNSGATSNRWSLRVYTSHGFIIRYQVAAEGNEVHLSFDGGEAPPPGWLFRTVIQHISDAEFAETVQVAPPGRQFFDYYVARLTRVAKSSQPAPAAVSSAKQ